jgi:hypothetical protein
MQDIIITIPWQCGDKDCAQQWHLANYWVDPSSDTGYTVDLYSDGDHDDCAPEDVPSFEEQDDAWARYWIHVMATGEDVLHQCMVKREITRKARWAFGLQARPHGVVLTWARQGNRVYKPGKFDTMPRHVIDYLNVDVDNGYLCGIESMDDLLDGRAASGYSAPAARDGDTVAIVDEIEHKVPRSEDAIRRDVRAIAARAVQQAATRRREARSAIGSARAG